MAEDKKKPKEISPEKKEEYAKRNSEVKKAKIRQRRKEKAEGTTDQRRLAFIANIMEAYGLTRIDIAKRINTTPQNLYYVFSVMDDCSLSKAEQILEAMNLSLKVDIINEDLERSLKKRKPLQNEYNTGGTVSKIVGNIPGLLSSEGKQCVLSETITNYPKDSRLSFLANYLIKLNRSMRSIERDLNRAYGTIAKKFMTGRDDIDISMIYEIANVTGGEIHWIINPIEDSGSKK